MNAQSGFDEGRGEVNLVARVLYGIAVAELDMPHIVLTRSTDTGETTYSGPYATGLEALAAAESEWRVDREAGGGGDISFHVAALYPALEASPEAVPRADPLTVRRTPEPIGSSRRPSAAPASSRTASLVNRLKESIEARRARPCRHCGAAPSRVVLVPADTWHPGRQ